MRKRYTVVLSEPERARLHTLIGRGAGRARALTHARILLKANQGEAGPGWTDQMIAGALESTPPPLPGCASTTPPPGWTPPWTARRPSASTAASSTVSRRPAWPCWRAAPTRGPQALDVAAAGRSAGRAGDRGVGVVRDGPPGLEANRLKPWLTQRWCIPPEQDAEFCWRMEDVLGVYTRPYDPRRPQVCLDETSRQLLAEVSPPRPVGPGRPARQDYEYQRRGVCNLFLVCEPLAGWRDVMVSDRRTRIDWAHCVQDLLDVHYPDAERVVLVQDNLNTHTPASLYEAFAPAEARRLADRLELHSTPKHGSWLNMAEIELAMLAQQCLDRRLADQATLEREVAAWQAARNACGRGVDWRFTTEDARIKLKHLYPAIQS
jgi:hypothetical protein